MKRSLLPGFALTAALLLAGCDGAPSEPTYEGPPILVVGADGLEWSVMRPLLRAGRMPNLQSLIDRGTAGWLATDIPTFSPVVWTSIITGVRPETHGIYNFMEVDPNGRPVPNGLPYTSESRRVPALWNIADDHGVRVLSVAWWVSWPAEMLRFGRIVASYAAQLQAVILWKAGVWQDGLPELTWPEIIQEDIKPILAQGAPGGPLEDEYEEIFGTIPNAWKFLKEREALFRMAYRGDATHIEVMKHQLRAREADLNLVYVGLPDVAGHFFWRYREPDAFNYTVNKNQVARCGEFIDNTYVLFDDWLGQLLAEVDVENTMVMVLSDHGMHAFNYEDPKANQSGAHEDAPPGAIVMAGPGIRKQGILPYAAGPIGTVYDVTPTLLDWLGIPAAKDMIGNPLRGSMNNAWKEAHPIPKRVDSYTDGFRAPRAPREPMAGASAEFQDAMIQQIGYAEAMEREAERRANESDDGR